MRITSVSIKNYRSFGLSGKAIEFPTAHTALVGKNNAGKSNIISALSILLGNKSPFYHTFKEEDYFDNSRPIEISVNIGDINASDKSRLMVIPGLTKPQQGALNAKIADGTASISFTLIKQSVESLSSVSDEGEETQNTDNFEIKLWGFQVHRKKEEVRRNIICIIVAPSLRNHDDHLSASRWTDYGQLMKEVLQSSTQFSEIKALLISLNAKIKEAFQTEKKSLLKGTQVVSAVEDIEFLLTKGNDPTELLRNLEIFVKESSKYFNIENVGTGTQSAVIISMLELSLKSKFASKKLFCIEEPECFIHPHGIRYIGSLIREITGDSSMQILASTHSLSLLPSFSPNEIVRVVKNNGETDIKQATSVTSTHFKRFINQNTSEIFFSDRLVFVEGSTEKHLLGELDKIVKEDPTIANSSNCNFDRLNIGIIELNSVESLMNYIVIAEAFDIPFIGIVDKDFLTSNSCNKICTKFSITYPQPNTTLLISDLKAKNIIVNTHGEIEDLFSNEDIATISGKSLEEVIRLKELYPTKTSKAFKKIFEMGKPEYSIKIAEYYTHSQGINPLEGLIRSIYKNNVTSINI